MYNKQPKTVRYTVRYDIGRNIYGEQVTFVANRDNEGCERWGLYINSKEMITGLSKDNLSNIAKLKGIIAENGGEENE